MNEKIDVLNGVKELIEKKKVNKIEVLLEPYREDVIAIHAAGLSWVETAEHINKKLSLNQKQKLNARSLSQIAKQWVDNKLVDQNVIDKLVLQLNDNGKVDVVDKVESTKKVDNEAVFETYKTLEDFTADAMKSADQRFHSHAAIHKAFVQSKGKSKREMLTALRDVVANLSQSGKV